MSQIFHCYMITDFKSMVDSISNQRSLDYNNEYIVCNIFESLPLELTDNKS